MEQPELLLHQLFQTVRIITKGLNKCLEPAGLYSSEWSIITALKKTGPISQKVLASYLNIEPPAVSRTLVNLEQKNLIIRTSDSDKRKKNISLSQKAMNEYPTWLEMVGHNRNIILSQLTQQQQHELRILLETIFQSANNENDPKMITTMHGDDCT